MDFPYNSVGIYFFEYIISRAAGPEILMISTEAGGWSGRHLNRDQIAVFLSAPPDLLRKSMRRGDKSTTSVKMRGPIE